MTDALALLREWGQLWGVPGLETRVRVRFSERLARCAGVYRPERAEIRLHAALRAAPPGVLVETLAHEAAHAAVAELHPGRTAPHGWQWAALMRLAGFEPRVRLPWTPPPSDGRPRAPARPRLYEHRCPVCQARRVARRRVRGWRCAACVAAGLPGDLHIQPLEVRTA